MEISKHTRRKRIWKKLVLKHSRYFLLNSIDFSLKKNSIKIYLYLLHVPHVCSLFFFFCFFKQMFPAFFLRSYKIRVVWESESCSAYHLLSSVHNINNLSIIAKRLLKLLQKQKTKCVRIELAARTCAYTLRNCTVVFPSRLLVLRMRTQSFELDNKTSFMITMLQLELFL